MNKNFSFVKALISQTGEFTDQFFFRQLFSEFFSLLIVRAKTFLSDKNLLYDFLCSKVDTRYCNRVSIFKKFSRLKHGELENF